MNILERIAVTLWQMEQGTEDIVPAMQPPETSEWRDHLATARAVLLAIRQPDDEMITEGGEQIGIDGHRITPKIAGWTWERMVEKALQSHP